MLKARWHAREHAPDTAVPATTRVLAVASGKGGVGKSSVTVNLAAALAQRGFTVGVLDADIWGFSVPRMLGVPGRLAATKTDDGKGRIAPNEKRIGAGLLKIVSTGNLVDDEGTALMWRGLMLTKAVEQFLRDVAWGHLDYLLIDMPPGTGDVQMGLARMLPRTDLLIVTTPAVSAQKVAIRAADMARRSFLRVAGVIENMSAFTCDHGETYALFGTGRRADAGRRDRRRAARPGAAGAGGGGGRRRRHAGGAGGRRAGGGRLPGHRRTDRHRDRPAGGHGGLLGPPAGRRRKGPRARLSSSGRALRAHTVRRARRRPRPRQRPDQPLRAGPAPLSRTACALRTNRAACAVGAAPGG